MCFSCLCCVFSNEVRVLPLRGAHSSLFLTPLGGLFTIWGVPEILTAVFGGFWSLRVSALYARFPVLRGRAAPPSFPITVSCGVRSPRFSFLPTCGVAQLHFQIPLQWTCCLSCIISGRCLCAPLCFHRLLFHYEQRTKSRISLYPSQCNWLQGGLQLLTMSDHIAAGSLISFPAAQLPA